MENQQYFNGKCNLEKKRTARAEETSAYRTEQEEHYQFIGYSYPSRVAVIFMNK